MGTALGSGPAGLARSKWRVGHQMLHLLAEVGDLPPGLALDAGCGARVRGGLAFRDHHGGSARSSFSATALDFAQVDRPAADDGRRRAHRVGGGRSRQLDAAAQSHFDLVKLSLRPRGRISGREMVRSPTASSEPAISCCWSDIALRIRATGAPTPTAGQAAGVCRRGRPGPRLAQSGRSSVRRKGHALRQEAVSTPSFALSGAVADHFQERHTVVRRGR